MEKKENLRGSACDSTMGYDGRVGIRLDANTATLGVRASVFGGGFVCYLLVPAVVIPL